jgi:hypothetical protein
MTDRETLLAMLDRAGITYDDGNGPGDATCITITETPRTYHAGSPVIGYTGFMTTVHFDADGALAKIGVWE